MISARAAGRTTIVSLVTTRVELSQRVVVDQADLWSEVVVDQADLWSEVVVDQAFPSEPLGSPVNPHDVVKGGY